MHFRVLFVFFCMTLFASTASAQTTTAFPPWLKDATAKSKAELVSKYGEAQRARIERGLKQVGDFWRSADGDQAAFEAFVSSEFAGDQQALDTLFTRFERLMEQLDGHMHEINREFRNVADLDVGPIQPYDEIFAGYDPGAHVLDDFFQNKLAFAVLLNFPLTTLEERLTQGPAWTRRQWAEARLAQRFSKRIPADVQLAIAEAASQSDAYIASYNIWMHHVVDDGGNRLFPAGLRLLSHWNLRDEIKADYSDKQNGLAKQRAIQQVMERIVTQTIPASVIDNPYVDWNPFSNQVKAAAVHDGDVSGKKDLKASNAAEPDTRYAMLWKDYLAVKKADPYSPTAPTHIARRFDEDREIPEARFEAMLKAVVTSPLAPRIAKLIETRLGRPLEPFDIWYNGFRARGQYTEAQLDEIVSKKYATAQAYKDDIANILVKFGWTPERARQLAANIVVDPARGSGHAMGAGMRSEKAHLRTRVEKSGMNYKGYNIAVHEMGHNVEQTLSLNDIDFYHLSGVPNTAFTEALAMVLQNHDLELLGLAKPDAQTKAMATLNEFWGTYEIAGVALVDMAVWHWMYDHPKASAAELKQATVQISKDIWNRYYAPVFGKKDVVLLGIYSHMIDAFLYLPDYPLGHMIAFQIEEKMEDMGKIGPAFENAARYGRVAPDVWMKHATGAPVGAEALLAATEKALQQLGTATPHSH
ncbi:MAG TPA: hypothetical protein VMS96_09185 [Terriglobales bacterium]|nr:hypothetical protein [Terriglobales bacterium]